MKVSIVGFGRFGKVLYELLKDDFDVIIYQRSKVTDTSILPKNIIIAENIADVYESDVIIFAVPIEAFEDVIVSHKQYFKPHHLLIDVLSVKLHPTRVFKKYLGNSHIQALLTHPMFGPDSSKSGFDNLPIILDQFWTNPTTYRFWKEYFQKKKLCVIEMSAREHDRIAASSQGLTHFIGRLLDSYGLESSQIDSLGTKKLLEVKEQTCHDTWQLFTNLQHYNPYTNRMRLKLGDKFDQLYNDLLPEKKNSGFLTIGIQGGKGSFNEAALYSFLKNKKRKDQRVQIKYLYTSESVLRALHTGIIDKGQVAIHNSQGGVVEESLHALAKYKCKIVDQFSVSISHTLMIRSDADFSDVTTIMTHPQVLAQCKETLKKSYTQLILTSGTRRLIDQALVAKQMGEKKLPKQIATLGNKTLASIYGLKIIDDNLQDLKNNYTSFIHISRL